MKNPIAFDDAVDLLDTDHKAVKTMFIDYAAMLADSAPMAPRYALAQRICLALTVHAQIEEEIFYPQVREALDADSLMDEAVHEHAEAKETIALLQGMKATDPTFDATVHQLGKLIDQHVAVEREQIFLQARNAALDLRGMVIPLLKRQQALKKKLTAVTAKAAA